MYAKKLARQCENVSGLLKAMAHPVRLRILCHLSDAEKTVGELEELCAVSQSQASQFLGRMKSEGLLDSRREGNFVYYRIGDENVVKLIQSLQRIYCA